MSTRGGYLKLHREALVVDTHCDALQCLYPEKANPITPYRGELGLGRRTSVGHVDIPRLLEEGVDCRVFAIGAARTIFPSRAVVARSSNLPIIAKKIWKRSSCFTLSTFMRSSSPPL